MDKAIRHEEQAVAAWREITSADGDVYARNLKFGMAACVFVDIDHRLPGHWLDELGSLEAGLGQLRRQRHALTDASHPRTAPAYRAASTPGNAALFQIHHPPITTARTGESLTIKATVGATNSLKWVRLRYHAVNQMLDYETLPMTAATGSNVYSAEVPAAQIDPSFDFMYFIEVMDQDRHGHRYPGFEPETPYFILGLERAS